MKIDIKNNIVLNLLLIFFLSFSCKRTPNAYEELTPIILNLTTPTSTKFQITNIQTSCYCNNELIYTQNTDLTKKEIIYIPTNILNSNEKCTISLESFTKNHLLYKKDSLPLNIEHQPSVLNIENQLTNSILYKSTEPNGIRVYGYIDNTNKLNLIFSERISKTINNKAAIQVKKISNQKTRIVIKSQKNYITLNSISFLLKENFNKSRPEIMILTKKEENINLFGEHYQCGFTNFNFPKPKIDSHATETPTALSPNGPKECAVLLQHPKDDKNILIEIKISYTETNGNKTEQTYLFPLSE